MRLKFSKYHGNGNDFIIIDNRDKLFPSENHLLVNRMCHRHFGIGADGLMLLEKSDEYDFQMVYFNADGKEGSMCGNGGRCIVSFAAKLELITKSAIFSGSDGLHKAEIDAREMVRLKMVDVNRIERDGKAYIIDTGSPHYVIFKDEIGGMDVYFEGRKVRYSEKYREKGINVNFVKKETDRILIRTYERGVENETFACGTGSVAAAIASVIDGCDDTGNIRVETKGGILKVTFRKTGITSFSDIWLTGPVRHIFDGTADTGNFSD